jgi:P27 family predicted phage terminase small subunit
MKPGRKPKPTVDKKLAGNPGNRPINENEPQFKKPKTTRAPVGLPKEVNAFWRKYAVELIERGVMTGQDIPAFLMMANHYTTAQKCFDLIQKLGLAVEDKNGSLRKNPLLQVARDNSTSFRLYANEFGLTPSARTRLEIPAPDDNEKSLSEKMANDLFKKVDSYQGIQMSDLLDIDQEKED